MSGMLFTSGPLGTVFLMVPSGEFRGGDPGVQRAFLPGCERFLFCFSIQRVY